MGVRIPEERFDGGLAQRVVSSGDDLIEIDEADVFLFCDLSCPTTIVCGVPNDLAVFPCLPRNWRTDDRDSSLGPCVFDVLAQIPTVGVDGFVDLEDWIVDFLTFVTDAMDGSAGTGGIVEGPIVVVTPLEEDDIARFDEGQCLRPLIFHNVGPAATTPDGAIVDIDSAGVEEVDQRLTPPPLTTGAVGMTVADSGIPHKEKGWKLRVGRGSKPNFRVSAGIGGGALHRERLGRTLSDESGNGDEDEGEKQRQNGAEGRSRRQ